MRDTLAKFLSWINDNYNTYVDGNGLNLFVNIHTEERYTEDELLDKYMEEEINELEENLENDWS